MKVKRAVTLPRVGLMFFVMDNRLIFLLSIYIIKFVIYNTLSVL